MVGAAQSVAAVTEPAVKASRMDAQMGPMTNPMSSAMVPVSAVTRAATRERIVAGCREASTLTAPVPRV
jgi:hypothetical protein